MSKVTGLNLLPTQSTIMSSTLSVPHTPLCWLAHLRLPISSLPGSAPTSSSSAQGFRDLASLWLQHILLGGCNGCSLVLVPSFSQTPEDQIGIQQFLPKTFALGKGDVTPGSGGGERRCGN